MVERYEPGRNDNGDPDYSEDDAGMFVRFEDWEAVRAERDALVFSLDKLEGDLVRMREQRDALQRFKDYAHQRLDGMGVPTVVEYSPHTKAGCRIGGRLDWVEKLIGLNSWIACSDALPEDGKTVIVPGGIGVYKSQGAWGEPTWMSRMPDSVDREIQWPVTHWMPLPDPPCH